MDILDSKMEKMFQKSKKELVENASYYMHNITIDVFRTVFELRSRRMKMVSSVYICIVFLNFDREIVVNRVIFHANINKECICVYRFNR